MFRSNLNIWQSILIIQKSNLFRDKFQLSYFEVPKMTMEKSIFMIHLFIILRKKSKIDGKIGRIRIKNKTYCYDTLRKKLFFQIKWCIFKRIYCIEVLCQFQIIDNFHNE